MPPGVLFLQVDGLGFDTVRRAVRDGDMPTFARWLAQGSHALTDVALRLELPDRRERVRHPARPQRRHPRLPLVREGPRPRHGVRAPRGRGRDRAPPRRRPRPPRGRRRLPRQPLHRRRPAREPHDERGAAARGLGQTRAARVAGGASARATTPTSPTPYNAVRTLGAALADIVREITASVRQRRAGVRPRINRGGLYPFARAGTNVIARDVVVAAIIEDMLDGRACVYADFLGYDEVAHHSGIERFDALAVLREIDRQIGRLLPGHPARARGATCWSRCPTTGRPRARRSPTGSGSRVEELVGRLCGGRSAEPLGQARRPAARPRPGRSASVFAEAGGPVAQRLRARVAAHPRRPPAHRVRRARPRHPGGARRGGRLVRARRDGVVRRAPRPGRAGDDRGGVPRPAARAGRPPRRRVRARALGRVRPGRARPRRRAPARDRRGARRGPARPLRPARRRPRPPRGRLPALPGRHDQQPLRPR